MDGLDTLLCFKVSQSFFVRQWEKCQQWYKNVQILTIRPRHAVVILAGAEVLSVLPCTKKPITSHEASLRRSLLNLKSRFSIVVKTFHVPRARKQKSKRRRNWQNGNQKHQQQLGAAVWRNSVHCLNCGVWFRHRKDTAALVCVFFYRKGRSNILKPMYNMLDVSCAMKTRHSGLLHIFFHSETLVLFSKTF